MILDILPLSGGTARLVRVYGDLPSVALPSALPSEDGGSYVITELGDYCFSEKPRSMPAFSQLCRYAVDDAADGAVPRLTHAFGQAVNGGAKHRYDFDFGDDAADDTLHPICGNFVEEIILPDNLCVIGSCAFYNCRKLRVLSVGAENITVGSDVFLNCFALETIIVRAEPDAPTGLFALVGSITEAVQAVFWPVGAREPKAGLWYPAFWEDVEECPAHILLHTFSGQGYHYRQCFSDGKLRMAEYDAIFPDGHASEDANVIAMLCFDRLHWPWQLSNTAADEYKVFLRQNALRVVERLLKKQDLDALRALIALDVMDAASLSQAASLAAKADNASAAALLADAEHKKQPVCKKHQYDFDF